MTGSPVRAPEHPDPMPARIAILDYGMGNLRSVEKALERVGAVVTVTANPEPAQVADGIILPGVGAFPQAMQRIREAEFDQLIGERLAAATPVLGICLGMQLLFETSSELGGGWGLGLLQGRVELIQAKGLKVPHIGWNEVAWRRSSQLTSGLPDPGYFYFANSFSAHAIDPGVVLGEATYGLPMLAAVEKPPLFGAQFHPEKSSEHGLQLLANFVNICVDARASNAAAGQS